MSVLTINHRISLVNDFITSVTSGENSYYCFISKADPWTDANGTFDDTAIPLTNSSISQTEQTIYQNLIYGKQIKSNDINYMIPRYNWSNGTVYTQYNENDPNLFSENFYVINDTYDVYKCINNGSSNENPNGVPSLYQPSLNTTIGNSQTPDGYVWKYMYTCDPVVYNNFQTASYIPVTPNNAVQGNAVPGTIDNIVLTNSGVNYQVYEEGFLQSVVNNYVVQLPSTSSPYNNYYVGSSIYFKAGFGSGQISQINSYDGTNKLAYMATPFDYYQNLQLSNVNGSFTIGNIIRQKIANIVYYYLSGYMNSNDSLVQTETGAYGSIVGSNSTSIILAENISGLSLSYPMYNTSYSPTQKRGTVNITANSLYVNAVSGNYFANDFPQNSFILIGNNANTNLRRVVSVNSTVVTVDQPFLNTALTANCYFVNNAISIDSFSEHTFEGDIIYSNLNTTELAISNVSPNGDSFIVGEPVIVVNSNNVSQGTNGTISFANSSYVILTNISGNTENIANLYISGLYSEATAYINNNTTYPNITISTVEGNFISGAPIICSYANGVPTGNALLISSYTSPDELTEYIISPSVSIEGDGNGAVAYCTVDLSGNNPSRSISSIILINNGQYYTQANAIISSNNLYGNGATVSVQISPVNGHGYDAIKELGAVYCGISQSFESAVNENYLFPLYGTYRTVGIIKNPEINDVIFNLGTFPRAKLNVGNSSGSFTENEIVVQASSNAAGVVVYSNSSFLELNYVTGTFIYDANNLANTSTSIYGWTSGINAHSTSFSPSYFSLIGNTELAVDSTSGGSATITQIISNTQVRATNVYGSFSSNDGIYENQSNAYANIVSIYTSNGTINSTTIFGQRFNQTARLTLSSNTQPFSLYENVVQDVTFATGKIISLIDELDFIVANSSFSVGDVIINANTGSNAIVTFANSTYIKVAAVYNTGFNQTTNKPFNVGNLIKNTSNTKSSTINNVYNVLILNNVYNIVSSNSTPFIGTFEVGSYQITGNNSGAMGIISQLKLPDLVRESGEVLYLENLSSPFTKSPTSNEDVNLIISF